MKTCRALLVLFTMKNIKRSLASLSDLCLTSRSTCFCRQRRFNWWTYTVADRGENAMSPSKPSWVSQLNKFSQREPSFWDNLFKSSTFKKSSHKSPADCERPNSLFQNLEDGPIRVSKDRQVLSGLNTSGSIPQCNAQYVPNYIIKLSLSTLSK